jgi:hypothetical protein
MAGKLCAVGIFFPILQEFSAAFINQRNIQSGDSMKCLQHIPQFLLRDIFKNMVIVHASPSVDIFSSADFFSSVDIVSSAVIFSSVAIE